MSQAYDNTDSGAVFKPRDNHKMILSGKLNNGGEDSNVVVTMSTLDDGRKIMDVYQKVGTLFENDKKGNDKAPDYSGPLGERRIATWRREKDGNSYMSLKLSDKNEGQQVGVAAPAAVAMDDSIPF